METYMELLGSDTNQFWEEKNQFVVPNQPGTEFVEELSMQETPPDNRGNKRTKKFTKEEDELLLFAWLEISMDATQGNEQSRGTYWKRIHDYFHKHKTFNSERSHASLTSRWQTIQENVNRFCGCYTQIQNKRQSGMTENDRIIQACALYKERDAKKRSFVLLHCWNILRHEQKWLTRSSDQKQKEGAHTIPATSTPGINGNHNEENGECHTSPQKEARPDGRKKEKERKKRGKNSISETLYIEALQNVFEKKKEMEEKKAMKRKERDDMFFELEEMAMERKKHEEKMALEKQKFEELKTCENKRLKLQERELELKQTLEDNKVMNMDLSAMSDLQQQYYKNMQKEIIARRFGGASS